MSKKTLFDKIWDAHVVSTIQGGPTQLYIDRHYCHEVTSPQAFNGLRERRLENYSVPTVRLVHLIIIYRH